MTSRPFQLLVVALILGACTTTATPRRQAEPWKPVAPTPIKADPDTDDVHASIYKSPSGRHQFSGRFVTDARLGLVWQRDAVRQRLTWSDAFRYCLGLRSDGGEWRLPEVEELKSIALHRESPGETWPPFFEAAGPDGWADFACEWSATPGASGATLTTDVGTTRSRHWTVYFSPNAPMSIYDTLPNCRVRCVRPQ